MKPPRPLQKPARNTRSVSVCSQIEESTVQFGPGDPFNPEFQGFSTPNTTQVPDEFFDQWMHRLSGAEIKVFLYISRRTLGFQKRVDAIGMDQLMNGIRTRAGRRLDHGTGLSESGVKKAVRGLIDKGLIRRVRQKDPQRPSQNIQSLYALRFRDQEGGHKSAPGGDTGVPQGGTQEKPTGGHQVV